MGILDWFGKGKSDKPGKDEFARLYEKYLRDARIVTELEYDAAEFVFRVPGAMGQTMGLHNIYRDYCRASAEERKTVLRRYGNSARIEAPPDSWAAVRQQLMPVIRTAAQNEMMRLSQLLEAGHSNGYDNFLFRRLSADSVMMIAHDRPDSMMMVNKDTLEKWGVSFEEAWQACLDNLRAASPEKPNRLEAGVIHCLWDDSYDSSRILLPDLINRCGAGNDPVIMIPTRNCLLLAPVNNIQAQERMLGYADQALTEQGRFVSALMYRYQGNELVPYQPTDPTVARKLHDMRLHLLLADYTPQRELLEKIDQKNGHDLFHATFKVFQSKTHSGLVSLGSVAKNGIGTLPQVDVVAFSIVKPDGQPGIKLVAWDDALAIGDGWLALDEQYYPSRYRVTGFPAQDKLDAAPETVL